jgi:hypothetical protein
LLLLEGILVQYFIALAQFFVDERFRLFVDGVALHGSFGSPNLEPKP